MHDIPILINITLALVVAFLGGVLARRVGLPTIVGYLLAHLDGSPAAELLTGENGAYAFGSLLPGAYQVRQDLLPGYVQTTPDPAGIDLAMGQALGGIDFGVVYSADLSVAMTADVNDRTIIYTFVVTNNGPAEALDAVLNNVRPHGVSYTTIVTTQGACQGGNTVACEFGRPTRGRQGHGDDPGQPDRQEQPD